MFIPFLTLKSSLILFLLQDERKDREGRKRRCVSRRQTCCLFKAFRAAWHFLHVVYTSDIVPSLFRPQLAGKSELCLQVHLQKNSVVMKTIRKKMCQEISLGLFVAMPPGPPFHLIDSRCVCVCEGDHRGPALHWKEAQRNHVTHSGS